MLNLAISDKFQEVQWGKVTFPGKEFLLALRIGADESFVRCRYFENRVCLPIFG